MTDAEKHGPPLLAMCAYLPLIAAAIAWNGFAGRFSSWIWVVDVAGGLLLYTFIEYAIHRWLFHDADGGAGKREVHMSHHRAPRDKGHFHLSLVFSITSAASYMSLFADEIDAKNAANPSTPG